MKKIISIILSLVMVLSMSVSALAAETTSITTILRDDDMVRIAQAISGDDRYVSTFDKQNNTITTERFSVSDGTLLATATVNLSVNTITETDLNTGIAVTSTTQSKYTDSLYGYEYTPGSPAQWRLQRPKYNGEPEEGAYYYRTNQTTTNKSDLNNFRTTVNSLESLEEELLAQVGTTTFFAGFATGFAIGSGGTGFGIALAAYIAAAGFCLTAQQTSYEIGEKQDDAYYYYFEVSYNSSIYY